ncbi:UDP-N-acetylglucosamine 1-carboxyvinyltransferase [Nisaea sediminum]|uniref:UDP-N-acetylglucosamine 1-carboxyvinyltransferase n=1 Tax=Nisaea sediminum TaxID=2775867 RepID=UPI001867041A|nr:UDP-N-acetylglucosamine 1-carboxyvinyltransferase [Nisaea sediminum]
MDKLVIRGGTPLKGQIPISGAKNAALPLMAATLLTDQPVTLTNIPKLADIRSMGALLDQHGVKRSVQNEAGGGQTVDFHAATIESTTAPYDLVRKMRASVLVLGPLLARCGEATVSLPGGCAIGNRPVDLHLKGLAELGAEVALEGGYVKAQVPSGRLHGGRVVFPLVSVGATENLMMAASLADGETVLVNAAREPEITDLAECLIAMGAEIEGHGTDTIHIQGKEKLNGTTHKVVADRIEAGTYAMAAAITGGDVELTGTRPGLLENVFEILREAGVKIEEGDRSIRVSADRSKLRGVDVMTEPFPGFPTDLQAQFMTLMCVARGASMVTETIFENRFMHVPELSRMGANINVHHASALIRGTDRLIGAPVMATDLRASVSLVLAGLAADGVTEVNRIYHLDRGYENLVEKLRACGADIKRVAAEADEEVTV